MSAVEVDLVHDPRAPRVRAETLRLTEAWRVGWRALAAERTLGGTAPSAAWSAAAQAWGQLGDADRATLAMGYAGEPIDAALTDAVTWAGARDGRDAEMRDRPVAGSHHLNWWAWGLTGGAWLWWTVHRHDTALSALSEWERRWLHHHGGRWHAHEYPVLKHHH